MFVCVVCVVFGACVFVFFFVLLLCVVILLCMFVFCVVVLFVLCGAFVVECCICFI